MLDEKCINLDTEEDKSQITCAGLQTTDHKKRGAKRNRKDTSLVFDERSCENCEKLDQENSTLKAQIASMHSSIQEGEKKVSSLSSELEEQKRMFLDVSKELSQTKEASGQQTEVA